MAPKKANDHWSCFLEEIEAPMWVDLTLEIVYNVQDVAEEWFDLTHPFHQCSSCHLKSSISHHSERSVTSGLDHDGPFSPKLPSSVSRSRGKDYRGKKLGHDPLKDIRSKSPDHKPASYQEIKARVTLTKSKVSSNSSSVLASENGESHSLKLKFPSRSSVSGTFMNSASTKTSAANSQTSITFESSQLREQNLLDVSSRAFSNSSGLLSMARRSLRKSCVTRQVSRMEIKYDTNKTNRYVSSSGKSSVSSSSIPGCDVNSASSTSAEGRQTTPESRSLSTIDQTDRSRSKSSSVSKMQSVSVQQGTSRSSRSSITDHPKLASEKAAKLKVQQSSSRKDLHPLKSYGPTKLARSRENKETAKISSSKPLVCNGKENARSNVVLTRSSTGRKSSKGDINWGRKGQKPELSPTCIKRVLAGSRDKLKAQTERSTKTAATRAACIPFSNAISSFNYNSTYWAELMIIKES